MSGGYLEPIVEAFGVRYLLGHRTVYHSASEYIRLGNEFKTFWNTRFDYGEVAKACARRIPEQTQTMSCFEKHLAAMLLDRFNFFIPDQNYKYIAGNVITQGLYIQNFQEASTKFTLWSARSETRMKFDKIMKQLEASINYAYGEYDDKVRDLETWARQRNTRLLDQLEIGTEVAFCGRTSTHYIVFSFELTSHSHGIYRLYNTGAGPNYTRSKRFAAYTEYHGVPLEWLKALLWKLRTVQEFDSTLRAYTPATFTKKVLSKLLIRGQVTGSCAWACIMLYLKVKLGHPEYMKLKASTQVYALDKLYRSMDRNDPESLDPAIIGQFLGQDVVTRIYPIFVYLRQSYFIERRLLVQTRRMEKLTGDVEAARKIRTFMREHLRSWMSTEKFKTASSWPEMNNER